jgi:hypothetical protein
MPFIFAYLSNDVKFYNCTYWSSNDTRNHHLWSMDEFIFLILWRLSYIQNEKNEWYWMQIQLNLKL